MAGEGRILVRRVRSEGPWTAPETSTYKNEAHLQELLVTDPSRVPGVTQDAYTTAELPTSAGPIDVCIVELDGSLTVVECKLASNWEARRMVIGQVIDYASAIWNDGEASFLRRWTSRGGTDLAHALPAEALDALRRNIADARIDLCLAVDSIDGDLRRLVEYLNEVTLDNVSVTALQLAYAQHGGLEILIPTTFGGEIAAAKTRTTQSRTVPWSRELLFEAISSEPERQLAAEYLFRVETLERRGNHEVIWYGAYPNGGVYLHPYGLRYAPIQLWVNKAGRLMLYGNWNSWDAVAGHEGFAGLARLLGQDHRGGHKGVLADSLSVDVVWAEVLRCAEVVNETEEPTNIRDSG